MRTPWKEQANSSLTVINRISEERWVLTVVGQLDSTFLLHHRKNLFQLVFHNLRLECSLANMKKFWIPLEMIKILSLFVLWPQLMQRVPNAHRQNNPFDFPKIPAQGNHGKLLFMALSQSKWGFSRFIIFQPFSKLLIRWNFRQLGVVWNQQKSLTIVLIELEVIAQRLLYLIVYTRFVIKKWLTMELTIFWIENDSKFDSVYHWTGYGSIFNGRSRVKYISIHCTTTHITFTQCCLHFQVISDQKIS